MTKRFDLSAEELQKTLCADSGFQAFLGRLNDSDRRSLESILADSSILPGLLQALPRQLLEEVDPILSSVFEVPPRALHLYESCHFFEARNLLLQTLELFDYHAKTGSLGLNQGVEFVCKRVQALCLTLLGEVEWELGNPEKAGFNYRRALEVAEGIDDLDTIAKALQGMGSYHWDVGNYEEGLNCCHRAGSLLENHDDPWRTRNKALTSLSVMYSEIGQYEDALEYAHRAVDLCEEIGDATTLPIALSNLANLYMDLGEWDHAEALLKGALSITLEKSPRQEALLLNNLAACLLRQEPTTYALDQASSYLWEAMEKNREMSSPGCHALTMGNLGLLNQLRGNNSEAGKFLRESAEIYGKIGAKASESLALARLGNHLKSFDRDFAGALKCYEKAIEILEIVRGKLSREAHRIGFSAMTIEPYEEIIDLLQKLGSWSRALEYVERAKSRSLLEFLHKKNANLATFPKRSSNYMKARQILEEMGEIQKTLEAIRRMEEEGREEQSNKESSMEFQEFSPPLRTTLENKSREFDREWAELHRFDPEGAALLKVDPLAVDELRKELPGDTLFIEFFQGEENLSLFFLSHEEEVQTLKIPLRREEATEKVSSLHASFRSKSCLDVRSHEFIREIRQPLADLNEKLFGLLKPRLGRYRRLLFAPHQFWHYLPFQALYDRDHKGYLCDHYEIGSCPSASVLLLNLQKKRLGRSRAAIFIRNNGDLPNVDREGELLEGLFYPNGHLFRDENSYLGRIAESKDPYDIIHMACHGMFEPEQPFLSGLDLPPGKGKEGRTFLLDLFCQRFDSNLVTLSACDTALHRVTTGDELIGISRGLFYSGATAVLLSLWQVADRSTSLFMENFYWHFIRMGETKSRSLQLAMQKVKGNEEYAHPYYWAPFVLMGDWR